MEQEGQTARRFFGEHAREYAVNPSFAGGPDLAALTGMLNLSRDERVLDVGTGTGFTALALAPLAKSVVGVDITDEMLEEARSLAKARGARNVRFERGSAMDLKFAGSTFDIVVARRAAHHFDARRFISEARRVLTPSGRLGIIDMSPPDGVQRFVNKSKSSGTRVM